MKENSGASLKPLIVHPLPVAPVFLGREGELARMRRAYERGGVVSLVGVGGSGKTATVERFLRILVEEMDCSAILVWSFYDDPDTNSFLKSAVEYLTGGESVARQGSGWFQLLKQAIEDRPGAVLILDGLERVQRPVTSPTGVYGEIEDPLLKALLARIAGSPEGTRAIITSRFPLADLDRLSNGYEVIDVDQLPISAAVHLLRSHGVDASDAQAEALLEDYGRHALTVDVLGAAAKRFFGGKVSQVPHFAVDEEASDAQARRLAQVLRYFEEGLDPLERDLMSRLCVFRFGVTSDTLAEIFAQADPTVAGRLHKTSLKEIEAIAQSLVESHLLYNEDGKYSVHPAVRDHFYSLFRDSAQVHGAISKHLLSLSNRPGVGLPTTKRALDLLEELVFHALKSGKTEEAIDIYAYRMGGNDHLNTQLGEYARTYRILQGFPECPDDGGMYHCMRAFGDFQEALKWRPQNRYIRLALGDLTDLAQDSGKATAQAARFLMGERVAPPDRCPDFPIAASQMIAMQGRLDEAVTSCEQELRVSLYVDDMARVRLSLVDIHVRQGRISEAANELEEIAKWVLGSGSQEHLCLYYMVSGRLDLAQGKPALSALTESLQLANEAGFRLFAVEVQALLCSALVAAGRVADAVAAAKLGRDLARQIRYVWGEANCLFALAEALKIQGEDHKPVLRELAAIQRRIAHPDLARTERLLNG